TEHTMVSINCPLQPATQRRMSPTPRSASIVLLLTTSTTNALPPLLLMTRPTPRHFTHPLPKLIPRRGTDELSTS
ncbi:hypothetical protein BC826DRAFT_1043766, partial [Russula brevipes]